MKERSRTVKVVAARVWDPENDNVDVEVTFADGRRFGATFFTLKNIERLFEKNRKTGECGAGLYLWAVNMVLVQELTLRAIERTVDDLLSNGEFEHAFEELKGGRLS